MKGMLNDRNFVLLCIVSSVFVMIGLVGLAKMDWKVNKRLTDVLRKKKPNKPHSNNES